MVRNCGDVCLDANIIPFSFPPVVDVQGAIMIGVFTLLCDAIVRSVHRSVDVLHVIFAIVILVSSTVRHVDDTPSAAVIGHGCGRQSAWESSVVGAAQEGVQMAHIYV